MIRKIIHIDEEKCNGCGLCANACHEGAIEIANGKAKLIRDDYCDGFGDCLPACPMGAISFEEREAAAYDEEAVKAKKQSKAAKTASFRGTSYLSQWPTQIKLMPITAPYYSGASLLVAADCTAFAYGGIQEDFIKGRVVINGCPKLDGVDYSEKLARIFMANDIKDITVLRMEVPCCGGIEMAVKKAILLCGKDIPIRTAVVSVEGELIKIGKV